MTTNPFAQLERTYRIIARRYRRSSETWADPLIDTARRAGTAQTCTGELDVLVHAVAAHRSDTGLSDRTIRGLVAAEQVTPDAFVILLHGLAPVLQARLGRATAEYRTELLSQLALVIRDASRNGELSTTSDLARRLTNRAHSRGHRRVTKRTDQVMEPDWFTGETTDFSTAVVERLDLSRFITRVNAEVEAGRISKQGWRVYQVHRLGRALGAPTRCTSTERSIASRTARQLRPHVTRNLSHAL